MTIRCIHCGTDRDQAVDASCLPPFERQPHKFEEDAEPKPLERNNVGPAPYVVDRARGKIVREALRAIGGDSSYQEWERCAALALSNANADVLAKLARLLK